MHHKKQTLQAQCRPESQSELVTQRSARRELEARRLPIDVSRNRRKRNDHHCQANVVTPTSMKMTR